MNQTTRSLRVRGLRIATTCMAIASLTLLTGCLQVLEAVTLNKDGSGTVTIRAKIDNQKATELKQAAEMLGGGGAEMGGGMPDIGRMTSMLNDVSPASIAAKIKGQKGLRITEQRTTTDKDTNVTTHRIVIAFDSLETYYRSGVMDMIRVSVTQGDDKNYTFSRAVAIPGMSPKDMEGEEGKAMLEQGKNMLEFLKDYVDTFEASFFLTAPSKLMESNGNKAATGHGIGWSLTTKTLFNPKNWEQTAKFSGEGVKITPFTLTALQVSEAASAARAAAKKAAKEAKKTAKTAEDVAEAAKKAAEADKKAAEEVKKALEKAGIK